MLTVFIIALGLSMDAFSVSVTNGMCMDKVNFKTAGKIAFVYAFFQFLMPVLGFFAGNIFESFISSVDHWIAFCLLFFIGIKMVMEAIDELKEKNSAECKIIDMKLLLVQGIATSIDALAVGISFAALKMPVFSSSLIIGVVTFGICLIGVFLGKKVGNLLKGKAGILGGLILIGIGTKILIEHLFF